MLATLAGYSLLVAGASLVGGWLPGRVQFSHFQFQLLLSLVGGLLLGIGMFHLLVHSVHELGIRQLEAVVGWMMAGILTMFFLLRAFHVHHHEPDGETMRLRAQQEVPASGAAPIARDHDHDHGMCSPAHDHHQRGGHHHQMSWVGLLFGLSAHTVLDGVALGASMQADMGHGTPQFAGLGVLLGIALHKPLDSLAITTIMMKAGCSSRMLWAVNGLYAALCPLGAAAFLCGVGTLGSGGHQFVGLALAFSAGMFVSIALGDLLPEMEFHSHHRWQLSLALVAGIALAYGIQFLEPANLHQ